MTPKKAMVKNVQSSVKSGEVTPRTETQDKEEYDLEKLAKFQLKVAQKQISIAEDHLKVAKSTNTLLTWIAIPFIISVVVALGIIVLGGIGFASL